MDRFRNTRQPDWDWWGRLWPTPGETLRDVGIEPGAATVDVGCGNGYFALPAVRVVDPAPVYALDIDGAVLDDLSHIADRQGIDNVVPIHGDARALAEGVPEAVDVVLVANTLHGVSDVAAFVEQVGEVLRPGGRFVVINWQDRPRETTTVAGRPRGPPTDLRMSPAETEKAVVGSSGFVRERLVDLPPYHYALLFER